MGRPPRRVKRVSICSAVPPMATHRRPRLRQPLTNAGRDTSCTTVPDSFQDLNNMGFALVSYTVNQVLDSNG